MDCQRKLFTVYINIDGDSIIGRAICPHFFSLMWCDPTPLCYYVSNWYKINRYRYPSLMIQRSCTFPRKCFSSQQVTSALRNSVFCCLNVHHKFLTNIWSLENNYILVCIIDLVTLPCWIKYWLKGLLSPLANIIFTKFSLVINKAHHVKQPKQASLITKRPTLFST